MVDQEPGGGDRRRRRTRSRPRRDSRPAAVPDAETPAEGPTRADAPARPASPPQGQRTNRRPRDAAEHSASTRSEDAPDPRGAEPPWARGSESERSLRSLVGATPSQLPPPVAMRARDASRPTDEDLAAAERDLVIVQRNYVPTETLPDGVAPAGGGRPGPSRRARSRRGTGDDR